MEGRAGFKARSLAEPYPKSEAIAFQTVPIFVGQRQGHLSFDIGHTFVIGHS
jgi:hypothetical protein